MTWPGSTQVEFPGILSDEDAVVVTVASLTDSASPRLGDVPLVLQSDDGRDECLHHLRNYRRSSKTPSKKQSRPR